MKSYTEYKDLYFKFAVLQMWKARKYSYVNVSRPDFGLLYLISGKITYRFFDNEVVLNQGDIIYLPKGSNYEVEFDINRGEVKNYLINFDSFSGSTVFDFDKPTVILKDNGKTLINDFTELVSSNNRNDHPLLKQTLFYKCMYNVFSSYNVSYRDKEYSTFAEIERLLSVNYNISVEEISKRFGISRSIIQKKFKKYYGCSPTEYRNEKRIEKAKLLLETTDMPIKEISDILGFYDTAYFYKVFKQHTCVTPLEYSKNININL